MKNLIKTVMGYKSLLMFTVIVGVVVYFFCGDTSLGVLVAAPIPLISFAKNEKDLTDEEKSLLGTIQLKCKEVCDEFVGGLMDKAAIEAKFKEISDSLADTLKGLPNFDKIQESYREQSEKVTALAEAFDKIKENGGVLTSVNAVEKAVGDFLDTPACQGYFSGREKSSGSLTLDLKGLVSVSNSSNTPLSNNRSTGRVVTAVHEQKLNLRDLMLVETGDPAALSISYEQVYDFDRNATVVSENGMGKRTSMDEFTVQHRGGKGIKGMQTIDEDYIEELFMTTTHHYIMFFTNTGRVYRLKAYEIPESGRTARGSAIVNLLQLQPGEKITAVIPLVDYEEGKYLLMATKYGVVKKSSIMEYANIRKTGLAAITLKDDDQLIEVKYTEDDEDVFLVTKNGQCIRFHESDVRCIGRTSMGVRGINLTGDDEVIGMQLDSQGEALLIVSANGMGKRTLTSEFTTQHRGGKGIKCYKITEKTGNVVGVKAVNDDNEIMMITTEGIIIRTAVDSISILGRNTSGVKVMNVGENVEVASIAKVREEKLEDEMEKNTTEE